MASPSGRGVLVLLLGCTLAAAGGHGPAGQAGDVAAVLASGPFRRAAASIGPDYDRFVRELIALTEVPAPPLKESRRAQAYLELMRQHGLEDVEIDPEGNVTGVRRGTGSGPMLAVVAHLDTVFPEGTDVRVRREGTRLRAPGIGDNTRGLASMLAVIRALHAGRVETRQAVLFVGSVGEEGEGDLRGVKYLLRRGRYKDRIGHFLAIDGAHQGTITRGGVGSRRYRVAFSGPGGHSYGAFGLVNPAYAMAGAIALLSQVEVPSAPRTTYNVGVVAGGTAVNAIPSRVSMDVDMRSESCAELQKLDATVLGIVGRAVDAENRARSTREGRVGADPRRIGERPCGQTPLDAPIVRTAAAVVSAFGLTPAYNSGSTDANIPMSLGIPAVTVGRGGDGGRSHSLDEWTDVERPGAVRSIELLLAMVVALAGMP